VISLKVCLVTGGCGFIGTQLVKRLVAEGYAVTVVDDLSTGCVAKLAKVDCEIFASQFDNIAILDDIKNKKFDTIFHLAAIPSVQYSVENPSLTTSVNVDATIRLFEAAIGNVDKIVFSSSAAVYGNQYDHRILDDFKKHPASPYAWQKSAIEDAGALFSSIYDIDIVSLRYFNVYGPGQRGNTSYSSVISSWCNAAIKGKELRLDGDGEQTRDYVYIDDVVSANIIAAKHKEKFNGRSYNIATGLSVSNNDVLEYFTDYFNKLKIKKAPQRVGDIRHSLGYANKIRVHLGFEPETSFKDGIKMTLDDAIKQKLTTDK
jgi:UDP-glucose 4-epimerase